MNYAERGRVLLHSGLPHGPWRVHWVTLSSGVKLLPAGSHCGGCYSVADVTSPLPLLALTNLRRLQANLLNFGFKFLRRRLVAVFPMASDIHQDVPCLIL